MPNHSFIGKDRDANGKGEYSAIYYNKEKFIANSENTFWLSPTPTRNAGKAWDAAYPRICTYGLFTDKNTKQQFWIINTHLDHVGVNAREQSIKLILEKITAFNTTNFPVIFMGDFNATPETKVINLIKEQLNDTKALSKTKPYGPNGTFNAFKFNDSITKRIDYIFTSKNKEIKINSHSVLSDSKDLKYPSDHLPVYITLSLKK